MSNNNPLGLHSDLQIPEHFLEEGIRGLALTPHDRICMKPTHDEMLFISKIVDATHYVLGFRSATHIRTVVVAHQSISETHYRTAVVTEIVAAVPAHYETEPRNESAFDALGYGPPFHHCGGSAVDRPYTVKAGPGVRADDGSY